VFRIVELIPGLNGTSSDETSMHCKVALLTCNNLTTFKSEASAGGFLGVCFSLLTPTSRRTSQLISSGWEGWRRFINF
jgi:hypothetical protein